MGKEAEYIDVEGNFFKEFIETYPFLKPTKKTGKFFGFLFVASVILSMLFINWFAIFSVNPNINIKIGFPVAFFEISTANPEKLPILIPGLIFDLLLFFVLGYIADALTNYVYSKIEIEKQGKKPVMYSVKKN